MTTEPIPPHLQGPIRNLNETLARLRTTRIRASQIEIPDEEPVTPSELANTLERPDAPPKICAVVTAVHEGRTSWAEVLEMGLAAAIERFPLPARPQRQEPNDDELEDFSEMTIMRTGW